MAKETKDMLAYRKKRVKRIKKIIVTTCVMLLFLPLVMTAFLFYKVNRLENMVDTLLAQNGLEVQGSTASPDVVKAQNKKEVVSGGAVTNEKPETQKTKKVYLTFDDGPSKETKKVLDVLKKKNVKATFYVIGREDDFSQSMYKRIVKEGHTLGMHSYSHIYQELYGSLEGFQKDFQKISDMLFDVTGVRSMYYRFPGGSGNSMMTFPIKEYNSFLAGQGVTYQDWNVIAANGTTDHVSQKEMVQSIMDGVARYDTSIVLMYDSADKKMTAKSLGAIIDNLQAGGYELLSIDENTTPVQHSVQG